MTSTPAMKYTRLGRSGLKVSRLCLGTMNFGPETTEPDSFAIMDRAHYTGINFFDTANMYGGAKGKGATEEIVGRWFAQGGERREKTVLATKLYGPMGSWPNEGMLSALNIRRACDASLKRLQTDYIDVYQMHHIDRSTPWDEIWEAMDVLRQQGKIIYVGSSNFAGWHLSKAQEAADRRNTFGLVSEQSLYNLLKRDIEMEVLPAAIDYGIGIIPWSPLQSGLLGGVIRKEREGSRRKGSQHAATIDAHRDQLDQYEKLCEQMGEEPGEVAIAWLLTRPGVTGPIIGPRTADQLEGALNAMGVTLEEDVLKELDAIFPGHKPSPEDYAW
ncbi:MAG: aldo/keto reductase [Acidimicrobiia bacterium]|nr:aldo/keto reductase [Acidimicrobiia bacterium]